MQLPAESHDTEITSASEPSAAAPGTSFAGRQVPAFSSATKAPDWRDHDPPTTQLPADGHDTELARALPPLPSPAVPGSSRATPHVLAPPPAAEPGRAGRAEPEPGPSNAAVAPAAVPAPAAKPQTA